MNVAIITVYQPFTNLGSFLQAYALKIFLEKHGHKTKFVKTSAHFGSIFKMILTPRPYRSYLLRVEKVFYSLRDLRKLSYTKVDDDNIDCYIWGSDEIWNVTNRFFCRSIFFGKGIFNKTKIGYAISVGHATSDDFERYLDLTGGVKDFDCIMSRDGHTQTLLKKTFDIDTDLVIDPTLLVNVKELSKEIKVPSQKYILVYTYGIDKNMIDVIKRFATKNHLIIVSPFFWHLWADKTIECSALQFSGLIVGAEYVFTTTFHGAIFSLINHSRCCILPLRPKVRALCETLKCEDRLISINSELDEFERTISKPFAVDIFESNLEILRQQSSNLLLSELNRISK